MSATTKRVGVPVTLADEMAQLIGCSKFTTAANKVLHRILRCDLSGIPLSIYHPRLAFWADNRVYVVDATSEAHFKEAFATLGWRTPRPAELFVHFSNELKELEKYKFVTPAPQPSKARRLNRDKGRTLRPSLAMCR